MYTEKNKKSTQWIKRGVEKLKFYILVKYTTIFALFTTAIVTVRNSCCIVWMQSQGNRKSLQLDPVASFETAPLRCDWLKSLYLRYGGGGTLDRWGVFVYLEFVFNEILDSQPSDQSFSYQQHHDRTITSMHNHWSRLQFAWMQY